MAGTVTAGQVDLSRLNDFLMSDRAPENGMTLSALDGFLTGIAVTPELILPSEWLPQVWGGEEPVFESMEEAQAILAVIMARYNEILMAVQHGPGYLEPVFWEGSDGETVIAADWAEGFVDAMKLRAETWLPLLQDKAAGVLLAPIVGLCADESGEPLLGRDGEENTAELLAEAPNHDPGLRGCYRRLLARACSAVITLRADPQRLQGGPQRAMPMRLGTQVQALLRRTMIRVRAPWLLRSRSPARDGRTAPCHATMRGRRTRQSRPGGIQNATHDTPGRNHGRCTASCRLGAGRRDRLDERQPHRSRRRRPPSRTDPGAAR